MARRCWSIRRKGWCAYSIPPARIWEMIDGRRTVAELAADIAAEYGIEASRTQADTIAFCEDLVRRGVLTVSK